MSATTPTAAPARIDAGAALRLTVLAAATFVYVTFEVLPVGLLHEIAADLEVSAGRVGLLVSGYAVVAAIVTIPTVALASRVSRRTALVLSLVVLVIAELLAATANGFAMLAVSRVAAALAHGILWSLVAPAAATLVPRERVGTATAVVFGGSTLAAILGSPGTTFVGELIGWRLTTLLLAVVTVAVAIALVWALKPQPEIDGGPDLQPQSAGAPADWRAVLSLCAVAVVLVVAHFVSYTYFAVIVAEVIEAPRALVVLLAVFGGAGAVGTYLVGRFNDRTPRRTAVLTMTAYASGVGLLILAFGSFPPAVVWVVAAVAVALWGAAFAAAGPVFQTAVMRLAGKDADRASSVYVTGFQIGIASGSALGTGLLGHPVSLPVVSAVLASAVLATFLVSRRSNWLV
ncbi:MFS transporter [Kribbella antibiotica]|uniref:MFS transporter n=1 Tax=Kribbella antibiotica TaxID=190195 RepID=A0A4V2YLU7_9ACTN|nr:MFS transporter [Kribbella antibiotica]TDD48047.1 MFS transporter [Kribbella antibiotica]